MQPKPVLATDDGRGEVWASEPADRDREKQFTLFADKYLVFKRSILQTSVIPIHVSLEHKSKDSTITEASLKGSTLLQCMSYIKF